ncbi:DUF6294 family protein [Streptomyces violascens]|uniref:DUF6294 family protein n=1 Tax=Streptomyces violascens TaxID=67381 RepID=UPI00364E9EF6
MNVLRRASRVLVSAAAIGATVLVLNPATASADSHGSAVRSGVAADYKWFTWDDLSVGDCHQTGGHLQLYSDGKLTFNATTWTTRTLSGDIWHSRFKLNNGSGQTLYTTGTYDSPTMWPSKHHTYTVQGTFEPSVYHAIARVVQHSEC